MRDSRNWSTHLHNWFLMKGEKDNLVEKVGPLQQIVLGHLGIHKQK